MSLATEAEFAGQFHNAKDGTMIRNILDELGWPQPPTRIQTDNSCACGITNGTIRQRKSKAMDMHFYWVQDRVRQGQFLVYWRKGGKDDLGDYFTKHYPTTHHRLTRATYLHAKAPTTNSAVGFFQGCVHLPPDSQSTYATRRDCHNSHSRSIRNSRNISAKHNQAKTTF
jgi:hypothetical protein